MADRDMIRNAYIRVRQAQESLLIAAAKETDVSKELYLNLGIQSLKAAATELGFDLVCRSQFHDEDNADGIDQEAA